MNLKEITRSGLPPAQSTTAGAHLRRPHRLRPRRCRRSSWRHREGHLQVVCLSTIKFSVMIIVFQGQGQGIFLQGEKSAVGIFVCVPLLYEL